MTTFYIYLMPYKRGGKTCYYCGYTNNPARREAEHQKETCYHWVGPLHVVEYLFDANSPGLAMKREKYLKKMSAREKAKAYAGLKP